MHSISRANGFRRALLAALATVCAAASTVNADSPCSSREFTGTYDLLQQVIFENRGCTNDVCHGETQAGGLDLRAESSYENLIEVAARTVPAAAFPGLRRVVPGQKDESLLFLNLAAAVLPEDWNAPLRAMPLGLPPISIDELTALRDWIEHGAPREGTVPGSGELLDACLPPAEPIAIEPLPIPQPSQGVQIRMPRRRISPQSESEVCFVSHYDLTGKVPAAALNEDGSAFYYRSVQIRQDPLSHHLFVDEYLGAAQPEDPSWGEFRCRGGEFEGAVCTPKDFDTCGPEGLCGSEPTEAIACLGFGPGDLYFAKRRLLFTQEASTLQRFPTGVVGEMPIRGALVWNSHAFNVTDSAGKLEAWLNFEFAAETDEPRSVATALYVDDDIFAMDVPAFAAAEVCAHHQLPAGAQLFELSSHTHRFGRRFRTYRGHFTCQGGERSGAACPPEGSGLAASDACAGAPCMAPAPPPAGDCDGDGVVRINDLTTAVRTALGQRVFRACPASDPNQDGRVSVAELVQLVGYAPGAYYLSRGRGLAALHESVLRRPAHTSFRSAARHAGTPCERRSAHAHVLFALRQRLLRPSRSEAAIELTTDTRWHRLSRHHPWWPL